MSGMKLSLNQVWTGLQHSLALADLPLRKLWKREGVFFLASDIARDKMPEFVVIYLDSDEDDSATDTASQNEDGI